MTDENKDILQTLGDKLKVALDEVNQIKATLMESPEVGRMKAGVERGAHVVGNEAARVFEELGRETYRLVKAGKMTVPDAVRDTFSWAEKNLGRFSEEEGAAPKAEAAADATPAEPPVVEVEPVVEETTVE